MYSDFRKAKYATCAISCNSVEFEIAHAFFLDEGVWQAYAYMGMDWYTAIPLQVADRNFANSLQFLMLSNKTRLRYRRKTRKCHGSSF